MQPLWESVWWFLKKLEIYLQYDSDIPFLNTPNDFIYPITEILTYSCSLLLYSYRNSKCPANDEWMIK